MQTIAINYSHHKCLHACCSYTATIVNDFMDKTIAILYFLHFHGIIATVRKHLAPTHMIFMQTFNCPRKAIDKID